MSLVRLTFLCVLWIGMVWSLSKLNGPVRKQSFVRPHQPHQPSRLDDRRVDLHRNGEVSRIPSRISPANPPQTDWYSKYPTSNPHETQPNDIADEDDLIQPSHKHFKSGFVSIIGNPNVGKSTIVNALMGQKLSIVSRKPQTTRHRIHAILTEQDYQVIFTDTPGVLTPAYALQQSMRDAAREAVWEDPEVTLVVTDVFGEALQDEKILTTLNSSSRPVLVVVNKVDLLKGASGSDSSGDKASETPHSTDIIRRKVLSLDDVREVWRSTLPNAEVLEVSATKGWGLSELFSKILNKLPLGPKYYPDSHTSDRNERFFAAETIRETIFEQYQDEVPYSCEVIISSFQDKSPTFSVVEAKILVSRASQKAIVIGKQGLQLKHVGTVAREKLEELLDRKVFLSLKVDVDEDWRSREDRLVSYGYKEAHSPAKR